MTFDGLLKFLKRRKSCRSEILILIVDGRLWICVLENLSIRVVLFVFGNRTFSSLLLCLGTVLPLKIVRDLIVLYCTGLDYWTT